MSPSSCEVDVRGDGSQIITFETGTIGRQANGAVMVRCGGTYVYTTACADGSAGDFDFCPLRIDYQERFSAAGLTKGGYVKRDGRASDDEVLVARIIDRPIRPMIAKGWTHDTQLLSWVLSYDGETLPDPLAVCGCAAALAISDIPLSKPVAAVRVGLDRDSGEFMINPTKDQMANSALDMMLAGTSKGVLMIEGAADFLTEAQMVEAVQLAHEAVTRICDAISEWAAEVGKPKLTSTLRVPPPELIAKLSESLGDRVFNMLRLTDPEVGGKTTADGRAENMALRDEAMAMCSEEYGATMVKIAFKKLCRIKMRELIRSTQRRSDGRSLEEVRPISIVVGMLPNTHGSALFTRGDTQALATVTLGDGQMQQKMENLDGIVAKRFYLQYSFPPSSVGEVGRVGAPGRREIGHGNLAERALSPTIPDSSDFPYSMRVESLITESSGSSSMASVCGGALALMDTGVPLKRIVAGVAMGLIFDEDLEVDPDPVVLTDILGLEDDLGTMDFKIAGDEDGISTFQLDIKCEGLSVEVLSKALDQAKRGRLHILGEMKKALAAPRDELPSTVPRMTRMQVPPTSIGKLIGPGGKMIRSIIEDFALEGLDVNDDGAVSISSFNSTKIEQAAALITQLVEVDKPKPVYDGPMPEEGRVFGRCEVMSVKNFGVFVSLGDEFKGLEGLVHISELHSERVRDINGFIKVGQFINVKVLGVNTDGKIRLSRKATLTNKAPTAAPAAAAKTSEPAEGS